jgi:hypothetical protein
MVAAKYNECGKCGDFYLPNVELFVAKNSTIMRTS